MRLRLGEEVNLDHGTAVGGEAGEGEGDHDAPVSLRSLGDSN